MTGTPMEKISEAQLQDTGRIWPRLREFVEAFLIRQPWRIVLMMLVLLLGYGYKLVTYSINNDHIYGSVLRWNHGVIRWGVSLLGALGLVDRHVWFWSDLVGMLLFAAAGVLWCFYWHLVSEGRFSHKALLVFLLLFLTYPLQAELFCYPSAMIWAGIAYGGVAYALCLLEKCRHSGLRDYRWGVVAALILGVVFAIYESFAVLYLSAVVMVLLYRALADKIENIGREVLSIRWHIGAFILGVLLKFLVAGVLLAAGFSQETGPANTIRWLDHHTLLNNFGFMILGVGYDFGYSALLLPALTTFWAAVLLCAGLIVLRRRNIRCWWSGCLLLGLFPIFFSLSLLQAIPQPYRTCQCISFFVSSVGLWLTAFSNGRWLKTWLWIVGVVIFFQTKDVAVMNHYDLNSSRENYHRLIQLGEHLRAFGVAERGKPIILVGGKLPTMSFDDGYLWWWGRYLPRLGFRNYNQNLGTIYFNGYWEQTHLLMERVIGIPTKWVIDEEYEHYQSMIIGAEQPAFPRPGFICETDQVILVNLGIIEIVDAKEHCRRFFEEWRELLRGKNASSEE